MPLPEDSPLRTLPDRVLRQSLIRPANLRALLKQAIPEFADRFDYESITLLDREFPRDDWRRREADLPFEIRYRLDEEERTAFVCVLIEHQSATDTLVPLRMLYFATGYWDRQWRAWAGLPTPRPSLRLHPVLPLVLYTGVRPWGSNRSLVELLDEPKALHRFAPIWEPLYWNLADQSPQSLLDSGEAWLQMMAVLRVDDADTAAFRSVYMEALRRLESTDDSDRPRWEELIRVILTWGQQRRPRDEGDDLKTVAAAVHNNAERQRRVLTMGQTIADTLYDEGVQKGIEKGIGKGELSRTRLFLRLLLEEHFGVLSPALIQKIDSSEDEARLMKAALKVSRMTSIDELQI